MRGARCVCPDGAVVVVTPPAVPTPLTAQGPFARLRTTYTAVRARRLWTTPPPVATDRTLSMVVAVFYLSGGLAAFFVALFEGDVQRRGWVAAMGLVAIAAGLLVARFPTSVPPLTRRLMNVGGTGFILVAVLVAGRDTGGEALFWLFCYVPLDSAVFFPWRMAIPMMGWGIVATGIAVFGGHFLSPAAWFILVMVALVMAFALSFLIRSAAEAEWDPASGMLSRRGFDRALAYRCDSAQADHPFSLAVVSIDDAGERARDSIGENAAESLRRRLAGRWAAEAPARVFWARLYDNRFAVISDDAPGFDAYLESVRASVGRPQHRLDRRC